MCLYTYIYIFFHDLIYFDSKVKMKEEKKNHLKSHWKFSIFPHTLLCVYLQNCCSKNHSQYLPSRFPPHSTSIHPCSVSFMWASLKSKEKLLFHIIEELLFSRSKMKKKMKSFKYKNRNDKSRISLIQIYIENNLLFAHRLSLKCVALHLICTINP